VQAGSGTLNDPTVARIVIDPTVEPGTANYIGSLGHWCVYSVVEAAKLTSDRSRWMNPDGSPACSNDPAR
jgi:hypothetical protein